MSVHKQLRNIAILLLAIVFAGCGNNDAKLHTLADLEGSHVAILNSAVSEKELAKQLPGSHAKHFKSSSEFLLALSIGKCDAGIVEREEGWQLLSKKADYVSLSQAETDSTLVIVHRSLLPGQANASNQNLLDSSIDRIHRNIISDGYWKLILKGFATTVAMFLLGIIQAFVWAILLTWMNTRKYLRYISNPLACFIKTIHDVPSIVLIFFFYYFVFASVHINGIVVCSIALGIYTSGSLMNIFKVHLSQIDKTQHAAAQMLGLTGWKKYRYVILPQAVKPMLPFIGGETKVLLRATSYAGYISELDLVKVTEIIRNQTYDVLIPLLLVSVVFLVLSHIIVESLAIIYNKAFKYD